MGINTLVEAFRSKSLVRQIEQSRPRLYRIAYSWCRNRALADDLVQETLARALQKIKQLRETERYDGWMFSILANCWRDYLRQHRDMENIDEFEENLVSEDMGPEHNLLRSEIVNRVRGAVNRLTDEQRQVLTLVDLEEFSYVEVANILAIPIGTVMSRLHRARRSLKEQLLPVCVEPDASYQSRSMENDISGRDIERNAARFCR